MTSTDDPDRIRREIERTQAGLSRDVDALTEKVTPSRIVERRVDRARGVANRWKENVMGGGDTTTYRAPTHRVPASGDGVRDTGHQASESMQHAAESVSGAAHEAPAAARRRTEGNPFAAGVIAFGVGMLVSSLVPASSREQQLTERARDRAGELGRPVAEAASQAAGEMRENLQEPAQQAAEAVRTTAADAGRTVADEGRGATSEVQGRARGAADSVRGAERRGR